MFGHFSTLFMKKLKNILKNYPFCRKSGNDPNSKDGAHVSRNIKVQCVRKSMSDSPLSQSNNTSDIVI